MLRVYNAVHQTTAVYESINKTNPGLRLTGRETAINDANVILRSMPTVENAARRAACLDPLSGFIFDFGAIFLGNGEIATDADILLDAKRADAYRSNPSSAVRPGIGRELFRSGIIGIFEDLFAIKAEHNHLSGNYIKSNLYATIALAIYVTLWIPRVALSFASAGASRLGACCGAAWAEREFRNQRGVFRPESDRIRERRRDDEYIIFNNEEFNKYTNKITQLRALRRIHNTQTAQNRDNLSEIPSRRLPRGATRSSDTSCNLLNLPIEVLRHTAGNLFITDLISFAATNFSAREIASSLGTYDISEYTIRRGMLEQENLKRNPFRVLGPYRRDKQNSDTPEVFTLDRKVIDGLPVLVSRTAASAQLTQSLLPIADSDIARDALSQVQFSIRALCRLEQRSSAYISHERNISMPIISTPAAHGWGPDYQVFSDFASLNFLKLLHRAQGNITPIATISNLNRLYRMSVCGAQASQKEELDKTKLLIGFSSRTARFANESLLGLEAAIVGLSGDTQALPQLFALGKHARAIGNRTYRTRDQLFLNEFGMQTLISFHPLDLAFNCAISEDRSVFVNQMIEEFPSKFAPKSSDVTFAVRCGSKQVSRLFSDIRAPLDLLDIEKERRFALKHLFSAEEYLDYGYGDRQIYSLYNHYIKKCFDVLDACKEAKRHLKLPIEKSDYDILKLAIQGDREIRQSDESPRRLWNGIKLPQTRGNRALCEWIPREPQNVFDSI